MIEGGTVVVVSPMLGPIEAAGNSGAGRRGGTLIVWNFLIKYRKRNIN